MDDELPLTRPASLRFSGPPSPRKSGERERRAASSYFAFRTSVACVYWSARAV